MSTLLQKAAQVSENLESRTRAGEFLATQRLFLAAGGDLKQAALMAEAQRFSPRVVSVLKTAVNAGSLDSGGAWGSSLGEYGATISAFLDSLRSVGAFDSVLTLMKRVPLRTRFTLVSGGGSGAVVPERHVSRLTSLTISGNSTSERKAVALLAVTKELMRLSEASALFANELRSAIALTTDQEFIRVVTDGINTISSSGTTTAAIRHDLGTAVSSITTNMNSKLFILVEPSTAKAWSFAVPADGDDFLRDMSPQGGSIRGVPVIVTDGLTAGTVVVGDANSLVGGAGSIETRISKQADLQFDTAPDSPSGASSVLKSLWTHDMIGLKAMRFFAIERMRTDSIAVIDNVNYYPDSPA